MSSLQTGDLVWFVVSKATELWGPEEFPALNAGFPRWSGEGVLNP